MLTEISLNVLDITQNSITAGATKISISVEADTKKDTLCICISDNGCGLTQTQLEEVTDPFYTTRTTRKVGLGIPFFKQSCEITGGHFYIDSHIGKGTDVRAEFVISSIDRMPLGDITETMHSLITMNSNISFLYSYRINERKFVLDTEKFREILGDIPFDTPEVSQYIKEYLEENKAEVDRDITL